MTRLDTRDGYAVLINTLRVAPERAEELMTLLERATEETFRFQRGFVSANLHLSADRKRIVNYAQWRSLADYQAVLRDPAARAHAHIAEVGNVAISFDPVIFELRYSDQAGATQ
jgi:heme-degrading monooxygenase HmoA